MRETQQSSDLGFAHVGWLMHGWRDTCAGIGGFREMRVIYWGTWILSNQLVPHSLPYSSSVPETGWL
jgi:hypothetical protein